MRRSVSSIFFGRPSRWSSPRSNHINKGKLLRTLRLLLLPLLFHPIYTHPFPATVTWDVSPLYCKKACFRVFFSTSKCKRVRRQSGGVEGRPRTRQPHHGSGVRRNLLRQGGSGGRRWTGRVRPPREDRVASGGKIESTCSPPPTHFC